MRYLLHWQLLNKAPGLDIRNPMQKSIVRSSLFIGYDEAVVNLV